MELGCGVAVAEEFGDYGRRCRANEALQGGVSCAEQINAQPFEPSPDHLWGHVPAGLNTGKQPWAGCDPTGGPEIRPAAGCA